MIRVTTFASKLVPFAAIAIAAWAIGLAAPAAAASRHAYIRGKMPVQHVRSLYDVAPQGQHAVNSDDPSLTGGGSLGYNQNIYNW
jgi:uncharacterized membrane protein YfbV (UPF0208 family)